MRMMHKNHVPVAGRIVVLRPWRDPSCCETQLS